MDNTMRVRFDECELYIANLKAKNYEARINIMDSLNGELRDEYLKSCDITDTYIKKLEKELQELRRCLALLEC